MSIPLLLATVPLVLGLIACCYILLSDAVQSIVGKTRR